MEATTMRRLGALLLALILLVTACNGEQPAEPGEPDPGTVDDQPLATDVGVTDEPCPAAVNPDNGCIYLGIISDLTVGPFAALAVPLTEAQQAFWARVNDQGGLAGYDIDTTTFVRDNEYSPETHARVFEEIRNDVLALAQTLGSPQTAAILGDLRDDDIVSAPASWTSGWAFEDIILDVGANYCFEVMNAVDYAFDNIDGISTVMGIHYPGDYGDDAAYGVKVATEANGGQFLDVPTPPGADNQAEAIEAIIAQNPDVVIVSTGPLELATIVGQAAARGYDGRFIGSAPTWNRALLDSPAAGALEALYWQSGQWAPFGADTPGHRAMSEALGDVTPSDGYTAGWVWQYPLKAAIESAIENGDLTRAGLRAAVGQLTEVDFEGMLPPEAGNFTGDDANARAFRQSRIAEVDPDAPSGVRTFQDFFQGPTVEQYELTAPCFQQL
jgi:ABC-type branched-subunit amino acid transport system substrate-binding protein